MEVSFPDQLPHAVSGEETSQRTSDCDAACQREEKDLNAQQGMERAAWAMFIGSVLSLVVSAVSLFLIWKTVQYTRHGAEAARDAVAEAKEATKAANAAVEETRRIGEAQTRAYVDVVSGEIDGRIEGGDTRTASCRVQLRNHGVTPAYDLACWIRGNVRPLSDIVPFEESEPLLFGNLGPTIPNSLTVDVTYPAHLQGAIDGGKTALFVWGRATYSDAFGAARIVEFELFSSGDTFAKGHFRPHKPTKST